MSDVPEIKAEPLPAPGTLAKLGRLRAIDSRDRKPRFRMAAPPTERTFRSWLAPGLPWNQELTPWCVAYAVHGLLVSHRVVNRLSLSHEQMYRECQVEDEWEGEDYDGTSVRAGFKVLKELGYVSSYTWATEPEQVIRHLLEIGPVVLGVDWLYGMWNTDEHGYIHAEGMPEGGHAILAVAVNRNRINPDESRGAIRILNSWGAWGDKGSGRAWLSFGDLGKLMQGIEGWPGEAAAATEIKPAG